MPTHRRAYGHDYWSYSLHDWRKLRSLRDIPREHWAILQRRGNFELANRIDRRAGAVPQRGGVDHIGAGFEVRTTPDVGAERLTEYGLNPGNTRASWNAAGDSDTICLLAPPDTRAWQHGAPSMPLDMNSLAIGYEDGILSPDWNRLPAAKRTAHLRMRAAFWALFFGDPALGWELKYTPDRSEVFRLAGQGRSWGLTQHGVIDPDGRSDAGFVWSGGRRINTFPYAELLPMIREETGIRAGTIGTTPNLPKPDKTVMEIQEALNEWGHHLDIDGKFGLTTAAATEVAAHTGFTGSTNSAAFITHLEDTMAKVLDEIARLRDQNTALSGYIQTVGKRTQAMEEAIAALPQAVAEHPYPDPITEQKTQAAAYPAYNNRRSSANTALLVQIVESLRAGGYAFDTEKVNAAIESALQPRLVIKDTEGQE